MYELLVGREGRVLLPAVAGEITWSTERKGAPGQLGFEAVRDKGLALEPGDPVALRMNGKGVFYGFAFAEKGSKTRIPSFTVYDQLRYFTNKDTYVYAGKTLGALLRMLAADFGLQVGALEDTGYAIPSRVEDNVSLFDMVQNAVDLTLQNTGRLYVLYDNYGRLELKSQDNMKAPVLLDAESAEDYSYTASIDDETYNQVKLIYDNSETGEREVYVARHGENINRWGLLQHYDTLQQGENGAFKAQALLQLYNQVTKGLSFTNVKGDLRVRAGSLLPVQLDAGAFKVQSFMLVEKCKHVFGFEDHRMELTLRGGDVVA